MWRHKWLKETACTDTVSSSSSLGQGVLRQERPRWDRRVATTDHWAVREEKTVQPLTFPSIYSVPLTYFHIQFTIFNSSSSACLNGCKVTLVAFVWLFSTMCLQMSPQNVCARGCKVTLVAFVWLFSNVGFQMCPQMACMRRCIITQVAIVWFFPLYIGNSFTDVLLHGMIRLKNLFNLHKLASCVTKIKIY